MTVILKDIPERFETDRLVMRTPRAGDGPELNRAVADSFAELTPWMDWAKEMPSVEHSETWVRSAHIEYLKREALPLLLFEKASGDLIGAGGFVNPDWGVPKVEIGYWCRTPWVGRGFITETVAGLTRFAFEDLAMTRVEVRMDELNERSWRVAERLGFRLEGTLIGDSRNNADEMRNTRIYAANGLDELRLP
jgi:RimJ/RimL family protein N-acetyltransferase